MDRESFFTALLSQHLAINTEVCFLKMPHRAPDLPRDPGRNDRKPDELRMRVFKTGPRLGAVILKNQKVLESRISFQIQAAVAEGPQHKLDLFERRIPHLL